MKTFFITIPKLARALCGGSALGMIQICVSLWSVLIFDCVLHAPVSIRVPFCYKKMRFIFTCISRSDIAVCKEVFLLEEYKWEAIVDPKIIIDLGAHVGDTALYYHACYPQAQIYAVEPDPVSFARLCENTKNIKEITPVHAAIGARTGSITLHTSSRSSLRASIAERDGATGKITVPLLTLSALYEQYKITRADLCKFDIEGGEKDMFGSLNAIAYADAYIGEFHGDLIPIDIQTFLQSFSDFTVTAQPMSRNNRFKIQAIKK